MIQKSCCGWRIVIRLFCCLSLMHPCLHKNRFRAPSISFLGCRALRHWGAAKHPSMQGIIARLDNTFEAFIDIVTTNIHLLTNSSDLPTMLPNVAKNTRQNATRCSSTDVGGFVGLGSLICLPYNLRPDYLWTLSVSLINISRSDDMNYMATANLVMPRAQSLRLRSRHRKRMQCALPT